MSIHANINSFNLTLTQYGTKDLPSFQKGRMTVIAMEGARSLTMLTPVDQGRAKGNWQVSVGQPKEGEIDRFDPSAQGTAGAEIQSDLLKAMRDWKPGDWIWFHNGVPYISVLNDGTESRTPHHMLERTLARLERWVGQG